MDKQTRLAFSQATGIVRNALEKYPNDWIRATKSVLKKLKETPSVSYKILYTQIADTLMQNAVSVLVEEYGRQVRSIQWEYMKSKISEHAERSKKGQRTKRSRIRDEFDKPMSLDEMRNYYNNVMNIHLEHGRALGDHSFAELAMYRARQQAHVYTVQQKLRLFDAILARSKGDEDDRVIKVVLGPQDVMDITAEIDLDVVE